ncbi:Sjogren's syndrome/scleroderma autoantigen 1 family protein [Halorubrum sp. Atlit-26R]|uniref:Sjogren's syndrome/scleroderma autoantigen 1 family protein n=1 Tax=Halorubrum sp. Atlit-26R TaxID=2282128 RepID=UPI000EF251DB|nr:Sjogren's syndrome/scleroderma autoantigen 1 family protein [Halorubrum sp. Atlit-26R]RLM72413.1 hypothetical protein DVK07_07525 [Halorubrum sp. Atlit-26R]
MSDGFDKEAEREKLREKFAEDEEKREHTQQMSELLLKGATMTNRHCGECGDPIFRYDGREFCPTCGNEAGGAAEANEAPAEVSRNSAEADGASADSGDAPAVESGTSADADAESVDGAVDAGANESVRSQSSPPTAAPQGSTPSQESASPRRSSSQRSGSQQSVPSRSADDAEGVDVAHASLTRTLTRFARAAEETDDPRRARDHLEAAREAAEALAALNR